MPNTWEILSTAILPSIDCRRRLEPLITIKCYVNAPTAAIQTQPGDNQQNENFERFQPLPQLLNSHPMMRKTIHYRFDIDTITCIEKGVPALLALAKRLGVRFSFYINMGHSIERREVLLRTPQRTVQNSVGTDSKISILRKLGIRDTFRTVFFNPRVAERGIATLHELLRDGHELGLHGGHNHSLWQRRAHEMTAESLSESLNPAYARFCELFGPPKGFTCPGANSARDIYRIVSSLGVSYVSDEMPRTPRRPYLDATGLWQIPVNAHACMIPLQEHYRAKQFEPETVLTTIFTHLDNMEVRTMYGHPVWEGYRDISLFETFIKTAMEIGYDFHTYDELLTKQHQ